MLLAVATAGLTAAPTLEERRATQAIGEAAELESALAKGDARRAQVLERRIRERGPGTLVALEKQAKRAVPEARFALARHGSFGHHDNGQGGARWLLY